MALGTWEHNKASHLNFCSKDWACLSLTISGRIKELTSPKHLCPYSWVNCKIPKVVFNFLSLFNDGNRGQPG